MTTNGRTFIVSPAERLPCTCYNEYVAPPPPAFYEREIYYAEAEPDYYVLKAVIPSGCRRPRYRRARMNCKECGLRCLGGVVHGTGNCLAATVEICAAFIGGMFRACSGGS